MKNIASTNLNRRSFCGMATIAALAALTGCSSTSSSDGSSSGSASASADAEEEFDTVAFGVLVADTSGEEALAFRNYYESYITANFNVTMTYTEALEDAAAERSAIEEFAAQGIAAIISLSSSDRATQIETCAEYGLYYAVASGVLEDEQYETYKDNEYFVGQIGPSNEAEYEAGYAMGEHFAGLGYTTVALYGAFIPNTMHVYRVAGVIVGLGDTYAGSSDMETIAAQLYTDQTVSLSSVEGPVTIANYFQGYGDTTTDEFNAAVEAAPDAFLSVGMTTTFFASQLDAAGIPYSDIDSFTEANGEHIASGTLVYLAGKFASSIGPIFAATLDAAYGNVLRDDDGCAISFSQGYNVATTSDEFDAYYTVDTGDSPIYSADVLSEVVGTDVTYDDFAAFMEVERA